MLIFHKERLVLLSTPKTGTTALEQALVNRADVIFSNPPGLKHMRAERFRKKFLSDIFRESHQSVELVVVMREPVDWLGSWFRYRSRPALIGKTNSTAGLTFNQFVQNYLKSDPPAYARVGSQARFLCDQKNTCLVDKIFDYRHVEQLHEYLSQRLNTVVAPQRLNVSPASDLSLSDETREKLCTALAVDFYMYQQVQSAAKASTLTPPIS